ncbi:protein-L-isoaspartate O-methyltransferase family protein [Tropicimonas sp. S265A]|uniref:protein-L-isoaspartate O-methyltransferase family protein n=1 Tax=Tropicimonas sp. S265A TaxID=3415134 RepID=UPI003C799A06
MTDFATRRTMMVDTQVRPSDVTKFPIIEAMLHVRREAFTPDDKQELAYAGENIVLTPGRVMLEPRTFAKMLDALDIQADELVLDLGCGFGYSSAILARLADAVVAVEEDEAMAAEAEARLLAQNVDNAAVLTGPMAEGAAKHGPYDVIMVQGGVGDVQAALLDQLKPGGRIACLFIEDGLGTCRIGYKLDGNVTWRYEFNAAAPILPGFEKSAAFSL